ncbi:MAG: FAD-binding oxidoreductase [Candidatus Bathyarchaeia archaeon]
MDLKDICGVDNYIADEEVLEQFSMDYSFAPPRRPKAVVKIKDAHTLREVMKWANETKTPLVPVSSGPPHFRGDTVPSTGGAVILDLSGMKKILHISTLNRYCIVEPGVTFGELQRKLAEVGLKIPMPLLPRSNKSVLTALLEREPVTMPLVQWNLTDPLKCLHILWPNGEEMMTGEAGFQHKTLEEQWKHNQDQILHMGPGQWDPYRIISGAQGTMGIALWSSIRCELIPQEYKLYFATSEKVDKLLRFVNRFIRFRYGDEILLLNRWNLATIIGKQPEEIKAIAEDLPSWILILTLAGYDILPRERVEYQDEDTCNLAKQFGLELKQSIPGVNDREMYKLLNSVSEDPYWKIRYKGSCQEIFFLTPVDRVSEMEATMYSVASELGYPTSEIGGYIQPQQQGIVWHVEFDIPYEPGNPKDIERVKGLLIKASEALMARGAYFSRPYGLWADMVYSKDAINRWVLRELKRIFDPNNIMNPGKLCF